VTKDTKIFAPVLRNAKLTLWPHRLLRWQIKHFEIIAGYLVCSRSSRVNMAAKTM
jgi:hypothetical protein